MAVFKWAFALLVAMIVSSRLMPMAHVHAAPVIIAESGFNDVSGVHSDAAPNSPFELNALVSGQGGSEPGGRTRGWEAEGRQRYKTASPSRATARCICSDDRHEPTVVRCAKRTVHH